MKYLAVDPAVNLILFIVSKNAVFGSKAEALHILKSFVKAGIGQHSINKILRVEFVRADINQRIDHDGADSIRVKAVDLLGFGGEAYRGKDKEQE